MKYILFVILMLSSLYSYSQDKKTSFSLDEAIAFALVNNRTIQNANRDIESAIQQIKETKGEGLPQIDGSATYRNALKKSVFIIGDQTIESGTRHSMAGTITLNQKIFDGSYLVALKSTKVFLEISKNAKIKTDAAIKKMVIDAYGNTLLAEEGLEILYSNEKILEKTLDETKKIFENGFGEEESIEQLEITLLSTKSSIRNFLRLRKVAYQMLNFSMGREVASELILTDNLTSLTVQNIDLNILVEEENIESTIDYKIAANDMRSKELLVKLSKSYKLPTLNTFINAGYTYNSESFKPLSNNNTWFGSSLFGLNLNVPIYSSGRQKASTARAIIDLEKSENNLVNVQQQLKLSIESAKSDYQFSIEEYETAKLNLDLAERIEQKNQIKFSEGISTSFMLREAQTQLYTSQQKYLESMLNVINTKAALENIITSN